MKIANISYTSQKLLLYMHCFWNQMTFMFLSVYLF